MAHHVVHVTLEPRNYTNPGDVTLAFARANPENPGSARREAPIDPENGTAATTEHRVRATNDKSQPPKPLRCPLPSSAVRALDLQGPGVCPRVLPDGRLGNQARRAELKDFDL